MTVHLFGAKYSPSCANFALKRIANDYQTYLGPGTADFLRENFYVDDGLKSVSMDKQAIGLESKSREMCAKGGLRLHKFISNPPTVL